MLCYRNSWKRTFKNAEGVKISEGIFLVTTPYIQKTLSELVKAERCRGAGHTFKNITLCPVFTAEAVLSHLFVDCLIQMMESKGHSGRQVWLVSTVLKMVLFSTYF